MVENFIAPNSKKINIITRVRFSYEVRRSILGRERPMDQHYQTNQPMNNMEQNKRLYIYKKNNRKQ